MKALLLLLTAVDFTQAFEANATLVWDRDYNGVKYVEDPEAARQMNRASTSSPINANARWPPMPHHLHAFERFEYPWRGRYDHREDILVDFLGFLIPYDLYTVEFFLIQRLQRLLELTDISHPPTHFHTREPTHALQHCTMQTRQEAARTWMGMLLASR